MSEQEPTLHGLARELAVLAERMKPVQSDHKTDIARFAKHDQTLEGAAAGKGVALVPMSAELTTVRAADLLNVSRSYLLELLYRKAIPHRKVGTHRRILMEDVMKYKKAIDREREQVLEQLTQEAQAQDMGYSR